jgi:hypothetical protein
MANFTLSPGLLVPIWGWSLRYRLNWGDLSTVVEVGLVDGEF